MEGPAKTFGFYYSRHLFFFVFEYVVLGGAIYGAEIEAIIHESNEELLSVAFSQRMTRGQPIDNRGPLDMPQAEHPVFRMAGCKSWRQFDDAVPIFTYCSQKHGCELFLDPPGRKSRVKVAEFTHPDPADLVSFLKASKSLYGGIGDVHL